MNTGRNAAERKALAIGAMFVAIVTPLFIGFWDKPLAWYFEIELDRDIHAAMGHVTEAANGAIWYGAAAVGLALSLIKARWASTSDATANFRRQARSWTFMIVSMLTAAALLNALKFAIGRYRPRYMFEDGLTGFEPMGIALKMASFPSGHTQSICSAMVALCFLTPRFTPLYVALAIIVSASRFVTAVHFVSDVIVGCFLSVAVAVLFRQWFERHGQEIRLQPS